jgi:hypothetical protein
MLARAHTFTIEGLQTRHVIVEVDIRPGLPGFTIVGGARSGVIFVLAAAAESGDEVEHCVKRGL